MWSVTFKLLSKHLANGRASRYLHKMKTKWKVRKIGAREVRKQERQLAARKLIWTLWYFDSREVDNFVLAFPSRDEAREHIAEGLGHLRRAAWRYCIEGLDPYTLKTVCAE
jgi:hypothetical protein